MIRAALDALVAKWRYVAENCRVIADNELTPEQAAAMRAAAVNRDDCANDLEALLRVESKVYHHAVSGRSGCGVPLVRGNSMPELNHVTCEACRAAALATREETPAETEKNEIPKI